MSDGSTRGVAVVPEPDVKATLRNLGITVPKGVSSSEIPDASALRAPLVLKAFGPGVVHKTDVGAVRLGLLPVVPADLFTTNIDDQVIT